MKSFRITSLLFLVLCFCMKVMAGGERSPYISNILDFIPAPGQFINQSYPTYEDGDSKTEILKKVSDALVGKTGSIVCLGAWGGHIIAGFDHSIVNVPEEADFKIYGNAIPTWAEPGIVMVAQDLNKDGLPDQWYELAGSEYHRANTIHNYQITYYKPDPLNSDVTWKDNLGHTDVVPRNNFHQQASYFPLWIDKDSIVCTGSILAAEFPVPSTNTFAAFSWGYSDNQANNISTFDIDNAVDKYGNSVHLTHIDFIKVHTGVQRKSAMSGEISTEFAGIEDLHVDAKIPVTKKVVLDLSQADVSDEGISSFLYDTENTYFDINNIFRFSHSASDWGGGFYSYSGFICSNLSPDLTEPRNLYDGNTINKGAVSGWEYNGTNEFAAMTGGGVDGKNTPYLLNFGSSEISFADDKARTVDGAYVTTAAVSHLSMKYGDSYAKTFGGENGTDPDFLKLIATGMNGEEETGKVTFFLANYLSDYGCDDYIISDWSWMDLSSLGKVTKIKFEFESSDNGEWGVNTPSYFCMDKLTVEKLSDTSMGDLKKTGSIRVYPSYATSYINVEANAGENISLFDLYGRKMKETRADEGITEISITDFPNGVYIVKVQGETVKILKR